MKSDLEHRCWTRRRFCNRIIAGVAGTVAVPEALAAPVTPLRAAGVGEHVCSGKPVVTGPFEADQWLAGAARRGLKIAVAHTLRMLPMIVALRAAVREGFLGDLSKMRAYGKQDTRAGGEDMMVLGT